MITYDTGAADGRRLFVTLAGVLHGVVLRPGEDVAHVLAPGVDPDDAHADEVVRTFPRERLERLIENRIAARYTLAEARAEWAATAETAGAA